MLNNKNITTFLLVAPLVCILVACGTATGKFGVSIKNDVVLQCLASHLKLTPLHAEGMTQNILQQFNLTNTGKTTCELQGYPDISLDNQGVLPIKNIDTTTVTPAYTGVITHNVPAPQMLKPKTTIVFWLSYPTSNTQGSPSCPQSANIIVHLPNSTQYVSAPAVIPDCQSVIYVGPFTPKIEAG